MNFNEALFIVLTAVKFRIPFSLFFSVSLSLFLFLAVAANVPVAYSRAPFLLPGVRRFYCTFFSFLFFFISSLYLFSLSFYWVYVLRKSVIEQSFSCRKRGREREREREEGRWRKIFNSCCCCCCCIKFLSSSFFIFAFIVRTFFHFYCFFFLFSNNSFHFKKNIK